METTTADPAQTVTRSEGTFPTFDGLQLHERSWRPAGAARAVVIVVHGLKDHSGRYDRVGEFLAGRGLAVRALDLRGHGHSPGKRFWAERIDEYLADIGAFFEHVRASEARELPIFLLGHSMGGALSMLYTLTRTPSLAGLILSGPAFAAGRDYPRFLDGPSHFFSRVLPAAPLLNIRRKSISRDPQTLADNKADPLVGRALCPVRVGSELLIAGTRITDKLDRLAVPTLIVHGTADRLTAPSGSEAVRDRMPELVTLKLYDGLYHEVFNEPERDQVLADVAAFIDERLAAG